MRPHQRQILFCFLVFISCNSHKNPSLNNLVASYGGKFDLYETTIDAGQGKRENCIKLISSNNNLIEDGWLLPTAMANNCAIMLHLFHNTSKTKNLLEVEIDSEGMEPFSFKYKPNELDSLTGDYLLVDTAIKEFVASAKSNNITKAKSIGYNILNQQEQGFLSFINEFQEAMPLNYKTSQIVGYMRKRNDDHFDYFADVLLMSEYNDRTWIYVSLIKVNEEIKIREIKF
jgi:hypothetical protein